MGFRSKVVTLYFEAPLQSSTRRCAALQLSTALTNMYSPTTPHDTRSHGQVVAGDLRQVAPHKYDPRSVEDSWTPRVVKSTEARLFVSSRVGPGRLETSRGAWFWEDSIFPQV